MDTNVLYYGDNLKILRDYIPDESIDLIYLDPPFNSNATVPISKKISSLSGNRATNSPTARGRCRYSRLSGN